ncbi:formate-dependent phosphoribosylglycinamide formyltransferase [Motilimonas cestriensis]|uniref:Formate-dependent phosphoribosylglycinamide formyltransferase n=1 Tax=Motilimonas cestriensis TaxID=2742685 RepID=A0ABS8W7C8_9GAMM|nr:formate-dependent phosphoribosylglycinamide formyltransferase [Motilimonas cestriensis]MCE2594886.1 formate-dependent phosphoribosylglycinamide formyltransferase [Motilimonas cestriensis]
MIGTANSTNATRALLLGSGELGKEVAIELQRFGIEVIALDRYENAPAMQVAHRAYTVDMLDGNSIEAIIEQEKPDFIIPEIEAIATSKLIELEEKGFNVVPTARATSLTMDREGIRRLAAEDLNVPTSPYQFVDNKADFDQAIAEIGLPCVVKPVMSSSGKGQSVIREDFDIDIAWTYAQEGGRAGKGKVIVEGFVPFDYEITLLTIRAVDGIHFCAPIGHRQKDGDYRESWQPQIMADYVLEKAQAMAAKVVDNLGGYGLFGVELFIKGEDVYFSEVSPRPHDTGMVTMISQDLSEFALHVRAILGLPIGEITQYGPAASSVIMGEGYSHNIRFNNVAEALEQVKGAQIRLFGKPEIAGGRRLGVALCRGESTDHAVELAKSVSDKVKINY